MHKIAEKEFTLEDFSCEHLFPRFRNQLHDAIDELNYLRDKYNHFEEEKEMKMRGGYIFDSKKDIWWQMIQLLPSSYNQTRNVMLNYEVLANIYKSRKDHKLDEWREFCKWIESLPYSDLIIQKKERGKRRLINGIDQDTMTNASSMNEAVNNWLRDKYPDGCPTAPTECDVQPVKDSMKKEE